MFRFGPLRTAIRGGVSRAMRGHGFEGRAGASTPGARGASDRGTLPCGALLARGARPSPHSRPWATSEPSSAITVNGDAREVAAGATWPTCWRAIGLDTRKVAVERNLEIVPRSTYAATRAARRATGWRSCISSAAADSPMGTAPWTAPRDATAQDDSWEVAGRRFRSRLIVGTGRYKDLEETAARHRGLRRRDRHRRGAPGEPVDPECADAAGLRLDPKRFTYLPNTAGCHTARTRCARCAWRARPAGGTS